MGHRGGDTFTGRGGVLKVCTNATWGGRYSGQRDSGGQGDSEGRGGVCRQDEQGSGQLRDGGGWNVPRGLAR